MKMEVLKMQKKSFVLLTGFLAVGLFLCCNGSGVMAQNVIKIGTIGPLTGPAAGWGLPVDRGIILMAEILNEAGGISIKGQKYKFEVFSENDKYNPEAGRAATEKLINRVGVKFILGSFFDGTVQAAVPLAQEKKVFFLMGSTGGVQVGMGPQYPYSFRYTQDAMGKLGVLTVALETIKFKKMAIFNVDNSQGRGNSEAAAEWAKENKMEITDNLLAPGAATDFYPSLKKILDKKPEMIHGAVPPGQFALVCKQAHELGYKGYYSNVGSLVNVPGFIEIAGKEAVQGYIAPYEFVDCPIITPESRAIMLKMQDMYLKKYGPPFEPLAWRYASGVQIVAQALGKAQTLDPDVVVKAMETIEFDTLLGKGSFSGKKTYGIPHQLIINTIAGIIKGDQAVYLGYTKVARP
jgi:branched-chain amino acid transport system substrate-binding protein